VKETTKLAIPLDAARWRVPSTAGWVGLAAMMVASASIAVGAPTSGSPAAKGRVAAGKMLYAKESCNACHKIDGKGGKMGPDLSKEGTKKRDAPWLVAFLKDPKSKNPNSKMPPAKGSQKDLAGLAAYMQSLK
jgi:mono/diheme cytochrome c family protein